MRYFLHEYFLREGYYTIAVSLLPSFASAKTVSIACSTRWPESIFSSGSLRKRWRRDMTAIRFTSSSVTNARDSNAASARAARAMVNSPRWPSTFKATHNRAMLRHDRAINRNARVHLLCANQSLPQLFLPSVELSKKRFGLALETLAALDYFDAFV